MTRRMAAVFFTLAMVCSLFLVSAYADEEVNEYAVVITVLDSEETPVSGAAIEVDSEELDETTDSAGQITIYLESGTYEVTASMDDLSAAELLTVADSDMELTITLDSDAEETASNELPAEEDTAEETDDTAMISEETDDSEETLTSDSEEQSLSDEEDSVSEEDTEESSAEEELAAVSTGEDDVSAVAATTWTSVSKASTLLSAIEAGSSSTESSPKYIKMAANITLSENDDDGDIIISSGYIYLDLNGYTLTGSGEATVIYIDEGATLVLEDSGTSGTITGGSAATGLMNMSWGGAVYVNGTYGSEGGTFIMNGGTISGNEAWYGGGVYGRYSAEIIINGGTICNNLAGQGGGVFGTSGVSFTMNGGTITGNTAELRTVHYTNYDVDQGGDGGGVCISGGMYLGGTFTMNGGTISENTAEDLGGGVYAEGANVIISGGTISANTSESTLSYSGLYINAFDDDESLIQLSGSPVISDNEGYGIYLYQDDVYIVLAEALQSGADIVVTTATTPTDSEPVQITTPERDAGTEYYLDSLQYFSTTADVDVTANIHDGYLQLGSYVAHITADITYLDAGGEAFSGVLPDDAPTEYNCGTDTELAAPTRSGYAFVGWYLDSACTEAVTVLEAEAYRDDIVLYALWEEDADVFSVTVPATLQLTIDPYGNVYAATEAEIVNNSSAAVTVTSICVTAADEWTLVPYDYEMSGAKVDSSLIGLTINEAETTQTGSSEALSLSGSWNIDAQSSLSLDYDAVISAMTQAVTGESVLTVVFVLNWAA